MHNVDQVDTVPAALTVHLALAGENMIFTSDIMFWCPDAQASAASTARTWCAPCWRH